MGEAAGGGAAAAPARVQRLLEGQYRLAYALVAAVREPGSGAYADAYHWTEAPQRRMGSIAACGVGLIALCLAHAEGWEPQAGALALQTLRAMAGELGPWQLAREPVSGFYAHFFHLDSGARWRESEYSTIDTALLVAGGLFAARYFTAVADPLSPAIARLAEGLWEGVDWGRAVADGRRGALYMVVDPGGVPRAVTRPFNEYALLAWLIARGRPAGHPYRQLWEGVYAPERLTHLPHAPSAGRRVLTDDPDGRRLLSSFVVQFPFYLVHPYTLSPAYREAMAAAAAADWAWWREQPEALPYLWGLGAGASGPDGAGYHADAVGNCPGAIASPHIVAGFLPVAPHGAHDLAAWAEDLPQRLPGLQGLPEGLAAAADGLPTPAGLSGLHPAYRFGLQRLAVGTAWAQPWYPRAVPLVDWSTMLYGLAAWRRGCGLFARCSAWEA